MSTGSCRGARRKVLGETGGKTATFGHLARVALDDDTSELDLSLVIERLPGGRAAKQRGGEDVDSCRRVLGFCATLPDAAVPSSGRRQGERQDGGERFIARGAAPYLRCFGSRGKAFGGDGGNGRRGDGRREMPAAAAAAAAATAAAAAAEGCSSRAAAASAAAACVVGGSSGELIAAGLVGLTAGRALCGGSAAVSERMLRLVIRTSPCSWTAVGVCGRPPTPRISRPHTCCAAWRVVTHISHTLENAARTCVDHAPCDLEGTPP
eukprot:351009-Chlamydomonas_euryale.AAC.3